MLISKAILILLCLLIGLLFDGETAMKHLCSTLLLRIQVALKSHNSSFVFYCNERYHIGLSGLLRSEVM